MKEFEDQQDAKFEQVEIGNEELVVVFTSTVLIYTEIAHNSFFPTPCFLRFFVCFLEWFSIVGGWLASWSVRSPTVDYLTRLRT